MSQDLFSGDTRGRRKTLQEKLVEYMRTGKVMTEEIYRSEIGGKSVSAALFNVRSRGHFDDGEYVVQVPAKNGSGGVIPGYRLVKEAPKVEEAPIVPLTIPHEEPPEIPKAFDADWGAPTITTTPVPPPQVRSITVGVANGKPELMIMFEDGSPPLTHRLTPMDIVYLMRNLEPFAARPRE